MAISREHRYSRLFSSTSARSFPRFAVNFFAAFIAEVNAPYEIRITLRLSRSVSFPLSLSLSHSLSLSLSLSLSVFIHRPFLLVIRTAGSLRTFPLSFAAMETDEIGLSLFSPCRVSLVPNGSSMAKGQSRPWPKRFVFRMFFVLFSSRPCDADRHAPWDNNFAVNRACHGYHRR